MKILIENSTWNNIGDAWYQTSLYHLIKALYPNDEVYCGEGPIKRAFRIKSPHQLSNSLNLFEYQDADIYIYSGPILKTQFLRDYAGHIKHLCENKKSYALISVSGTGLDQEEKNAVGDFLVKYPPLFFSSRDEETYYNFKPYVKNIYNGICTAFLVDKTMKLQHFKLEKDFFISSFYTELEPTFNLSKNKPFSIENIEVKHHKSILGLPFKYSRHFDFLRKHQTELSNHLIIRTVQNLNTKFNHINFSTPNSFISFNPISYLNLTKSSLFVISDRVHACAIALACGKPTRFLFSTKRAGIFDRMGFNYKNNNGIMYPNDEKINLEKELLEKEIKKYI